jgi:RNA polymerase sigma factor (sigma-70 family)
VQFRGETVPQFLAFLKTVVRNRAIDLLQAGRKWPSSAADRAESDASIALPDSVDVFHDIADEQCLEFLRQEIALLKRDDRELYLMKARGLKEREIAEQTGRPPGTVSSQIARLLERLRSALRDRGCL